MEHLIGLFDPTTEKSETDYNQLSYGEFNFDEFDENENHSENSLPSTLPPEEFYGSVEYKRQLIKPTRKQLHISQT